VIIGRLSRRAPNIVFGLISIHRKNPVIPSHNLDRCSASLNLPKPPFTIARAGKALKPMRLAMLDGLLSTGEQEQ
jgi:hypothetical protein